MIIRDADKSLASAIADMFAGSPQNMWSFPLSPTGELPVTHWLASGPVPECYKQTVPWQIWNYVSDDTGIEVYNKWVLTESYPGRPDIIYGACQQPMQVFGSDTEVFEPKIFCTFEQIKELFNTVDVTDQNPWLAMDRLGLKPVQVVEPQEVSEL